MPSFIGFIPTPREEIDGFFELVPVSTSDVVYDLGSGDGRLLFAALEKGAGRGVGIEIDPGIVRQARSLARMKGLEERVAFLESDVMEVSLTDATVVLCYLSAVASTALKPKFESELEPGTRIVMEDYPILEWKPVRSTSEGYTYLNGGTELYLYIVPPKAARDYRDGLNLQSDS